VCQDVPEKAAKTGNDGTYSIGMSESVVNTYSYRAVYAGDNTPVWVSFVKCMKLSGIHPARSRKPEPQVTQPLMKASKSAFN
jgi:hypothetical protein